MRYLKQQTGRSRLPGFVAAAALTLAILAAGPMNSPLRADELKPNLYVPYEDLVHLIAPADKAVLMDRAEFEKLLLDAEASAALTGTLELGQVKLAEYSARVKGEELSLTGRLDVVSIGAGPVAVPLSFAGIGLTRVTLDGEPAPLGYDKEGRLTLVVRTKGPHRLEVAGVVRLKELATGGTQFSISIPQAVAGTVKLRAEGDLEIHATVPASQTQYDKQADATSVELTIGGQDKLAAVLLGNGRQEDDRAIMLGESAATVNLTASHQTLSCLYTVHALRRGVRQLDFRLPASWTVTQVASPALAKWSVGAAGNLKTLSVRLRSAKVGTNSLHIRAEAIRKGQTWEAPRISLVDAAFQRGFLMVNTDEAIGVRGEKITAARRQDALAAVSVPGLITGATGPLYFHWGDDWAVNLELADVQLKRSTKERQSLIVSPQQVALAGDFEVTAVERELFDLAFVLRGSPLQWQLQTVLLDGKQTGFEYRIENEADHRLLIIELSRPIQPEKTANVTIVTRHVPADWLWPSDAPDRTVTVPLIESQADTVSGYVSVWAEGDLDAEPKKVPEQLEPVPVGRMASLGIAGAVRHAYSHSESVAGDVELLVSRRRPRTYGDAVGLITVQPREFSADWRITYFISRASTKRLYLLADKSLGREFKIASSTVPINSKSTIRPDDKSIPLSGELAARYNLWLLNLDHSSLGQVVIDIHYEKPLAKSAFEVPLVRPISRDKGQTSEQIAIQASEELAVTADAGKAKEIDAIDLPPLPARAARILWAFRLAAPDTPDGETAVLAIETDVHEGYEIPSALAVSAHLTTYLDTQGGQRSQANLTVANAGRQFLTIRLPENAELWSLRVGDRQVKPQRSADGDYQVALGQLGRPVPVKIVYSFQPEKSDLERLDLGGIELPGVEINRMNWTVVPPPGYQITAQHTKMLTHDVPQPTPAYIRLYDLLTRNIFAGSLVPMMKDSGREALFFRGGTEVTTADKEVALGEVQAKRRAEPESRPSSVSPAEPQPARPPTQKDLGVRLLAEGRSTLPVDLIPTAGAGRTASFSALGAATLSIGLSRTVWMSSYWAVGFILIAVVGVAKIDAPSKTKAKMIIAVLALASLLALWRPTLVHFANGAFTAAICLIPLYVLTGFLSLIRSKLRVPAAANPASVTAAVLLICILSLGCSAQAAVPTQPTTVAVKNAPPPPPSPPVERVEQKPEPIKPKQSEPLIIPYDADPTAIDDANKVLIPYARFIELWNQAHPDDAIEQPKPAMDISLADVRYDVKIDGEQLNLLLTADVVTYGRDWAVLPMPISGLAVVEATIDGKSAQFHSPPQAQGKTAASNSMVLMLPGKTAGELCLKAVAKPEYFGPRGNAKFSLPPLPGAVMQVTLSAQDLELEVDNLDNVPQRKETDGIVKWLVPLGMTRDIVLRWLPKAGGGAADRTLSAASTHDIYAFHWAVVGVTKIEYSFSAGEHDRFACLLPEGATLTEIKGTNMRDYRDLGERTVDGKTFNLMEIRLHRPAKKQYDLTVRWLSSLPRVKEPVRMLLVRAADVTRESGSVTLHAAGGMDVKVANVAGGRRTPVASDNNAADAAELTADQAKPIAAYYWPYRPFELSVQFSRLTLSPKVRLDQLVRIGADRTELLAQAVLETEQGKIFGAAFLLPSGYELLSVVGPAVENCYERAEDNLRFLHVKFDKGRKDAKLAIVLIRRDPRPEAFDVPLIRYVDSGPQSEQQGRLAVQLAASLEAKTLQSKNLKPIVPQSLGDWLDSNQRDSVRFAYDYELADPSLQLEIRPEPTRIRVEAFAGLAVKTTLAAYTYRLRYDISGSPIDRLSFSLPAEYGALAAVDSPALRSVTRDDDLNGRTTWDVVLVNEVTGPLDIAVNFALPIDASTKSLPMPVIETEAPAGYRAVVAVQNLSRHDIAVADENRTNLTELAVSEQRKLRMSREMTESLQYVFQSFEKDWALTLDFTPAKTAVRIQAVVDLLELSTVIDRNGRTRCQAKLALQNRSEQFLRVKVPEGLRLWSATVASQPVKPVTDAEDVLIPLVKTSPGGLPYDVYLYLADDSAGAGPLVGPLDGITNLKPPAISVANMPVMQTTWSLRLPRGYRYMRPGGNMSPVAGTVEMLSLNIDAKLKQLERLDKTYRDVSGSNTRSEAVAGRNWEYFNEAIKADIQEAQTFLESNRSTVSEEDYERLASKLGGQAQIQDTIITGNTAAISGGLVLARSDLNIWLNADASNPGLAEAQRNNALQQKPKFIAEGEDQQIARLNKELEFSQRQLRDLQQQVEKAESAEQILAGIKAGKEAAVELVPSKGKEAAGLLYSGSDKKAEAQAILDEISKQNAEQIDRKQIMIRNQLSELADNRLRRHYQPQAQQEQEAQVLLPQAQIRVESQSGLVKTDQADMDLDAVLQVDNFALNQSAPQGQMGGYGGMGGMRGYAGGGYGGYGGMVGQPQAPAGQPQNGAFGIEAPSIAAGAAPTEAAASSSDSAALRQYVAKGTYSLPVTLPEGEVRLDFACPAGKAQLTIWAVPQTTIRNLCATATVIVALLIVLGIVKIWPTNTAPISLKRAILYLIVFAILTALTGLLGLAITLIIILAAEAIRATKQKTTPTVTT